MQDRVANSLSRAAERAALVRLVRRLETDEGSSCCGFVVGLSDKLVLVQQLSEQINLDGFVILRIEDIASVQFTFPTSEMSKRVLQLRNVTPHKPVNISLGNLREALISIKSLFPLIVIEREAVAHGECEIGQLKMIGSDVYALRWITPDAEWEPDSRTYRISDITRLQFGGGYETALSLAAGLIEQEGNGCA